MAQTAPPNGGAKRRRTKVTLRFTFKRGSEEERSLTVVPAPKPYDQLTVGDLKDLAKARKMIRYSSLRKDDLVALHMQYDVEFPNQNRLPSNKPAARPRKNQGPQIPPSQYDSFSAFQLRAICTALGIVTTRKDDKPALLAKILLHEETANVQRNFKDPAPKQDPPKLEEPPAPLPIDPGKDQDVSDPTPSVQPDAGIAKIPFADLERIVLLAKAKDIDFDEAIERARSWKQTNRNAFPDSADIALVETRANQAISSISTMHDDAKRERERAQAVKDQTPPPATPVVAAVDPPPPPPPPMVTATAAATPPTPPRRSWEWLYAIAAVLGAAIIGACIFFGLQAMDDGDDDNGGTPASGDTIIIPDTIDADGGLTDEEINILLADCSEVNRDKCREILENVSTNEELHAAINQIAMMEKNLVGNNGGNPAASASVSDLGKVLTSTGSGGGPNLDGIYTGSCEASQVGNDKIMFRSGKLGVCTEKVDTSKLDGSWQMVVDSVYHEVNGNSCTGCTQGFNLSSLPSTFTVTIKNGAAVIGSPSVASARYCTAKTEGLAYGHFNVEHLLPLPGMDAACK